MKPHRWIGALIWMASACLLHRPTVAAPLTTAFTYQGRLVSTNQAAPGSYDLRFRLWDADISGTQVLGDRFASNVVVGADGLFAAMVDFGSIFQGSSYWLETAVATNHSASFSLLAPRLPLTAMPYALYARNAGTATTASNVTGMIASSQLPANVARLDANQTFTGQNTFTANVGIGTTGAATDLEIFRPTVSGPTLRLTGSGGGGAQAKLDLATYNPGGNAPSARIEATDDGSWSAHVDVLTKQPGDNPNPLVSRLRVHGNGNVGIGTTNPREKLDVLGKILWGDVNVLGDDQGGSIEIGDSSSSNKVPYIDFHYGIGGVQDYNVRLINDADGRLTMVGNLNVTGALQGNGSGLTSINPNSHNHDNTYWKLAGNSGTSSNLAFLGTTDNAPLEFRVNGQSALRIVPTTSVPNLVGGLNAFHPTQITSGVRGAVVAGGGAPAGGVTGFGAGDFHQVTDSDGTIGGGFGNRAGNNSGTVDDAAFATVAGGVFNSAANYGAAVGGGDGNFAGGARATVPGGFGNTAAGDLSFAAGFRAKANHTGAFVWADSNNFDFASTTNNQFFARATGGARFVTAIDGSGNPTAGPKLSPGDNAWGVISDRNAKKNFQPVDGQAVVAQLAEVPITRWNYKSEPDNAVPHMGPTAQAFKAAFYPGRDDKSITTQEVDGVALAAIQGLYSLLKEKDAQLEAQARDLRELRERLAAVEKATQALSRVPGN
jgi:hypothetical protein